VRLFSENRVTIDKEGRTAKEFVAFLQQLLGIFAFCRSVGTFSIGEAL
jgi:hypothetical protein